MHYMFEGGFLGTKAPFFMDFVTIIVAFLPLLIAVGIGFAKKGFIRLHIFYQVTLFIISLVVVGWFEYGVRVGGGFSEFVQSAHFSKEFIVTVLIIHIIISSFTTLYWSYFIIKSLLQRKRATFQRTQHKKEAKITFFGIFFTSLTGIWIYLLLFL